MLRLKGICSNQSLFSPPHPRVSGAELEEQQACINGLHQDEPGSVANVRLPRMGAHMRSQLVYSAGLKIENRFLLSATVMRAVRMFHVNNRRTEDTVNRVFVEVSEGRYADAKLPEITPPPPIDELVIAPII